MKELLSLCLDALDDFKDCRNLCLGIGHLRGGESAEGWLLYTYITSHRLDMRKNPDYIALDRATKWTPALARHESESAVFWAIAKPKGLVQSPMGMESSNRPVILDY